VKKGHNFKNTCTCSGIIGCVGKDVDYDGKYIFHVLIPYDIFSIPYSSNGQAKILFI
jgi:hypothetical protein